MDGEPIIHAVSDTTRKRLVGVTSKHLFTVGFESSKIEVVGGVEGAGRLGVGADGASSARTEQVTSGCTIPSLEICGGGRWLCLPREVGSRGPDLVAPAPTRSALHGGQRRPPVFFRRSQGFKGPLGRAPLAPVRTLAVGLDGRLYGFCGAEIARMFCYHPGRREVTDLGSAVSVIERRRYGFIFSDAAIGRDGEIYFGEDDNLGHLWLYFPKIEAIGRSTIA